MANTKNFTVKNGLDVGGDINTDGTVSAGTISATTISGTVAYSNISGAPTTSLSFDTGTKKLTFTDESGIAHEIDISVLADDTNLARITSGTLEASTGIATFTRDDNSTFTLDLSSLLDTDTNTTYTIGLSDGATGEVDIDLTAGGSGTGTDTVTLKQGDNVTLSRVGDVVTISSSYTNTNTTYSHKFSSIADSTSINLDLDAGGSGSGTDSLKLTPGSNVSFTLGTDELTINATDNDTIYTAGTGLTLSAGNEFSVTANTYAPFSHTHDYAASNHSHDYLPLTGGSLTGDLSIASTYTSGKQAYHSLYIGGDGLAGDDAAIYIGNKGDGTGYGYELYYYGTGSGNDNKFELRSENLGSPKTVFSTTADGAINFPVSISEGGTLLSSKYAALSHSHSYLPLSGGTLTGSITNNSTAILTRSTAGEGTLAAHTANSTDVPFNIKKQGTTFTNSTSYGMLHLDRENHTNTDAAGSNLYFRVKNDSGTLQEYAGIGGVKTGNATGDLVFYTYGRGNDMTLVDGGYLNLNNHNGAYRFYNGTTFKGGFGAGTWGGGTDGDLVAYVEGNNDFHIKTNGGGVRATFNASGMTTPHAITSTYNGTALVMDGGASAQGIQMTPDSATTYPVFLRSNSASDGEASPWIYKENNTAWGIWHNNPINTVDFTNGQSTGTWIASNVGGGTNNVAIRLDMANGNVQAAGSVIAPSVKIGSEVILSESSDRADLLQISSTTSGWGGLQIRNSSNEGRWSFMTDGNAAGIYDDENGDWHIYCVENSYVELRHDGVAKLNTTASGVAVTGLLTATTKSFTIDHPTKEGHKLRYGSLEGPENGVYVRGRLRKGNTIELPEYWTKLVDKDSITVTLTAVGGKQDLWVENITNNTVIVGGEGAIDCFYMVNAERIDVDKLVVEFEEEAE